jgi:hypothetical protein
MIPWKKCKPDDFILKNRTFFKKEVRSCRFAFKATRAKEFF